MISDDSTKRKIIRQIIKPEVRDFHEKTGNRVVFLVDEIGQFISTNSNLMLNLQSLTEELGVRCRGKVWIIVTAQEDIDSMRGNLEESEEKKMIFPRFKDVLTHGFHFLLKMQMK